MAIETQLRGTAGFIVSEANNYRSRDEGIVAAGAAPGLAAGTILGRLTADDNYVAYAPGAETGAETIAGILYETKEGTVAATVLTRDAEVRQSDLIYQDGADATAITTANAALAALGIIVR